MLARWSSWRMLYLPLNGVQWLLIGAICASGPLSSYFHLSNLNQIENRRLCAQLAAAMCGDLDEDVETVKADPYRGFSAVRVGGAPRGF